MDTVLSLWASRSERQPSKILSGFPYPLDREASAVVIGVLLKPTCLVGPLAHCLAFSGPAIALFLVIVGLWHKAKSTVMASPLTSSFHPTRLNLTAVNLTE